LKGMILKSLCSISSLVVSLISTSSIQADDPFKMAYKTWIKEKAAVEENWTRLNPQTEKEWAQLEKAQYEEWARLKAEVEQKWVSFIQPSEKDWVEYNKKRDSRSRVDFKQGKVILEAVIPADDPKAMLKARNEIRTRALKIFNRENIIKERILEDQIINQNGEKIEPENFQGYLTSEILPEIQPDPIPFQSRDGIKRRRYIAEIDLVPDHIRIRAEKYLPIVRTNSRRFYIKPELILAIMHTESYFNPMAVSSCSAIGLMQIIPRFAGIEAYRFIYNKERAFTPAYLYNPENNIELGSAYLHLLKYRHFNDVKGDLKKRYLSITGYNWGPTSMRKRILDKHPVDSMSDEEVYRLLRAKTPHETREYIKKVIERMPIYQPFFTKS